MISLGQLFLLDINEIVCTRGVSRFSILGGLSCSGSSLWFGVQPQDAVFRWTVLRESGGPLQCRLGFSSGNTSVIGLIFPEPV